MGIVYEAEQVEPVRRRVALKVIKLGMDSKDVIARFEAERQALAVMSHPGIAQVLDGGTTDAGRPFFVMELVKGIPFTEYCDNHQLSLHDRIALFSKVAHAVQHAHQKGVIHRDLKPSNILVEEHDGDPSVKIIDFGIAKAISQPLTDKTLVTAYGAALGTLAYMSPEQAELSNLDIDTRSDIYSLGVMLFEVLVGELPVDPGQMGAVAFLAQLVGRTSDPERPSARMTTAAKARRQAQLRRADSDQLRKMLRGDLDWIVVKATEKDRNRRYDTANALAMDLERYLRNEPVLARAPTTSYRLRKFVRRNLVAVVAGLGIVLALMIGIVLATMGLVRATRAEQLAQHESATAREVSGFLEGLFTAGDPGRIGGRRPTVQELLDSGAVRIRRELADRPLMQAQLMVTIGQAYYGLREIPAAIELLDDALAIQVSGGASPDAVEHTKVVLAQALTLDGSFDRAEQLAREVLAGVGGAPDRPPTPVEVIATNILSSVGLSRGVPLPDGELMLRRLLERRDSTAPDDIELAHTLDMLCWVLTKQGDLDAAEAPCVRMLALRRRFADPDQMGLLVGLARVGTLRLRQGRLEESLALRREALALGQHLYGDTNREVAYHHGALADVFRAMGQPDSARVHEEAAAASGRRRD